MKNIYKLLACGIVALSAVPVLAQDNLAGVQGYLLSRYRSYNEELPLLSSLNNGFGTARSVALGGAYTSLGADLSSMAINPAGLGMYQSSEFGISTNLSISRHENSGRLLTSGISGNNTNFNLNNVGIAINLYEGLGDVTSFTFGFSYNRLADYNYNSSLTMRPDHLSLGKVFAYQLFGIPEDWIETTKIPWTDNGIFPQEWGAILGYRTGLLGVLENPEDLEWMNKPSKDPRFANRYDELKNKTYFLRGVDLWGNNLTANVGHKMTVQSHGGTDEYNIAGGFNLRSNIYLGFSIGLQDIYRRQNVIYSESYENNSGADTPAKRMTYSQYSRVSGYGYNFKVGVIANPIGGLRVGLAFHTPTWNIINKRYSASMQTVFPNPTNTNAENIYSQRTSPWDYEYEYKYNSYARLMAGASYTFGNKGLISVDYECDFYNWMRIRVPEDERDFYDNGVWYDEFVILKNHIKRTYKPRHIVRLGGEYKPIPALALRAGFAYNGSFLKEEKDIYNEPLPYKSFNISGGVGYRFNNTYSLDLAYVFMKTDYSAIELFYYEGYGNSPNTVTTVDFGAENSIKSSLDRHNIVLSFNMRF